jgi:aspartate aminotransferase
MVFASRTGALQPEGAYEVLARAQALEAEGRSIIHLEIGEPDFATPPNISLAGIDAIASGRTRYNPTAGLPALREVIARHAGEQRGVSLEANQVVVGPGAKPLLFFPTLALVESGDQVIYPDPGFPTYRAMIEIAGGEPVPVPLSEPDGFSFDLDALDAAISERTRLIIVNSPGNPTGATLPQEDLEHIAAAAQRVDAWVLSDEIYMRTVFDGAEAPSIASLDGMLQRTIIVDGFSKTYAMTGWRLGFGIMPAPLATRVALLLNHSVGCTAHFTQLAAIEALTGPQDAAHAMVASYQRRRDLVVAGLSSLPGVTCRMPDGAFYAFPNICGTGLTSQAFADAMMEAGVALLPGTAFGSHGEGFVRVSYANSPENLRLGLERMEAALRSRSA